MTFLHSEYEKFSTISEKQQLEQVVLNTRINHEFNDSLTLRELYIDLMMYDTAILHSKRNVNKKAIRTLITNKIVIQKLIKVRETMGETLVPDAKVLETARKCLESENWSNEIVHGLLQWVDSDQIPVFRDHLQRVMKQNQDQPQTKQVEKLMRQCTDSLIICQAQSTVHFRNAVCMVECLTFYSFFCNKKTEFF
jgi:hypothetical protein